MCDPKLGCCATAVCLRGDNPVVHLCSTSWCERRGTRQLQTAPRSSSGEEWEIFFLSPMIKWSRTEDSWTSLPYINRPPPQHHPTLTAPAVLNEFCSDYTGSYFRGRFKAEVSVLTQIRRAHCALRRISSGAVSRLSPSPVLLLIPPLKVTLPIKAKRK